MMPYDYDSDYDNKYDSAQTQMRVDRRGHYDIARVEHSFKDYAEQYAHNHQDDHIAEVTAERDRLREALDSARRGFRVIKRICDEARNDKSKIDDIRYAVRIEMEESDV